MPVASCGATQVHRKFKQRTPSLKPKTYSFECFRCRFTNDHTIQESDQEDMNWYYYESLNDCGANVFYYISGNLDDCGDEDAKRALSFLKDYRSLPDPRPLSYQTGRGRGFFLGYEKYFLKTYLFLRYYCQFCLIMSSFV